ncbi:hypothetical protein IID20_01595 [Patescibacteria group bacterium]|nr:hypothetical protein [Patescibacteria group bacterium]
MGNFKRDNRFSGRENSRGFSGRDSGGPTMHGATCDECGKKCEVPFKPRSDKPIFCNDCFRSKGNTEPRRFGGRNSGERSSGSGEEILAEEVLEGSVLVIQKCTRRFVISVGKIAKSLLSLQVVSRFIAASVLIREVKIKVLIKQASNLR